MILPYDLAFMSRAGKKAQASYTQSSQPPRRALMRFVPILLAASLLFALPAAAQPRVTIDDVRNIASAGALW
jgi:hypothetical protein